MGSAPVGFSLEGFVPLGILATEILGSALLLRMSGYIFLISSNLWSVSENIFLRCLRLGTRFISDDLVFCSRHHPLADKEQTGQKYLCRLEPVVVRCYSALREFNSLLFGNALGFMSLLKPTKYIYVCNAYAGRLQPVGDQEIELLAFCLSRNCPWPDV